MQAKNLIGLVLLDALGAGIPGHDASIAVEEIDGVVANAFDDRAQLRVVAAQGVERGSLLGHVAHKAQDNRAGRRLHGLEHDVDGKLGSILAQAKQVHGRAHLAGPWVGVVIFAMAGMAAAEAGWNQILDGLAKEFGLRVTE